MFYILTYEKIKWLQVGLVDDLLLKNIHLDLRGRNLKFLVDIISFSDLTLSDEGLLNHIAGSFPNVNSYVSYSEFSPINYYSYKNTITIGIPQNLNKNIKFWKQRKSRNFKEIKPSKLAMEILNNEF